VRSVAADAGLIDMDGVAWPLRSQPVLPALAAKQLVVLLVGELGIGDSEPALEIVGPKWISLLP
jgi:hypothetical protein